MSTAVNTAATALAAAQAAADRAAARLFAGQVKTSQYATRTARALEAAQAEYDLAVAAAERATRTSAAWSKPTTAPSTAEFVTLDVTAFGETRTLRCSVCRDDAGNIRELRGQHIDSYLVGRFPTGTKLHLAQMVLYPRTARNGHVKAAAVLDGHEFILSTTLYRLNRNVGRIVAWYDAEKHDPHCAR